MKCKLINGNHKPYYVRSLKLVIVDKFINDMALAHIEENTGLKFVKSVWNYEAVAISTHQVTKLLLTYNFITRFYNNADYKETLFLKFAKFSNGGVSGWELE